MKKGSIVKIALLSVAAAMLATAALIGIEALLIANESVPLIGVKVAAAVAVLLPVLAACMFVVRCADKNKMLTALCVAAVYTILYLLLAGVITPGGDLKLGWQIGVPFIAAVASSVWNSVKKTKRR